MVAEKRRVFIQVDVEWREGEKSCIPRGEHAAASYVYGVSELIPTLRDERAQQKKTTTEI